LPALDLAAGWTGYVDEGRSLGRAASLAVMGWRYLKIAVPAVMSFLFMLWEAWQVWLRELWSHPHRRIAVIASLHLTPRSVQWWL